ncbi:MAG: hypothetical protein V4581_17805 [Bacteroidota bacterium]
MKPLLTLFAIIFALTAHSQDTPPIGYYTAPTYSITGDFDGDGKQDTLNQFITDSMGNRLQYMEEIESETWSDYVYNFADKGYRTSIAIEGKEDNLLSFKQAQGMYCLINLGNLNKAKGDEIAIIPDAVDESRHSYCHIYSLCKGRWQRVFEFSLHEDAFDTFNGTPYKTLPGILEQKNGIWHYHDYLEMEYDNPKDVGNMMPLKVEDCE